MTAAVARFEGVVLLSARTADRIAALMARYAGQLPPCRERSELLDLTAGLRSDASNQAKVSESVSVQRPQALSCNDQPRDAGVQAAPEYQVPRPEFLSPAQAAAILGITAHGVRHLARTKALPAVQTPAGRWLLAPEPVRQRAAHASLRCWNP